MDLLGFNKKGMMVGPSKNVSAFMLRWHDQETALETRTEEFLRRMYNGRLKKKNRELHSLRCDLTLKLGVNATIPAQPSYTLSRVTSAFKYHITFGAAVRSCASIAPLS